MSLPPSEIEHLYAAGWAALQSNRMSEAEAAFLSVLTADPDHVDALNGLGTVYFHGERLSEAAGLYEKALAGAKKFYQGKLPDHIDWEAPHDRALLRTLHGQALVAYRAGKTAEAKRRFEHLLKIDPDDHTGSTFMLADIKRGKKKWDDLK